MCFAQTIPYDDLLQQLEISNLRELEDLIITHCFYPQLVKGKLDQKQHCLQARHHCIGLRHDLQNLLEPCRLHVQVGVQALLGFAQVEEVYGRDVRTEDVQGIVAGLQLWCGSLHDSTSRHLSAYDSNEGSSLT